MTATRSIIESWLREGIASGATHVIVACDTYDWDNYPVFVMRGESARARAEKVRSSSMQRVDEVYDLSFDLKLQLDERGTLHYGERPWEAPEIPRVTAAEVSIRWPKRPNDEEHDPSTCYRCWQVGRRNEKSFPVVCVVVYNKDSSHAFVTTSCAYCLSCDMRHFPGKTEILAALKKDSPSVNLCENRPL